MSDMIHGADEEDYLNKLIARSSLGDDVGNGLARRVSRQRLGLLAYRIRQKTSPTAMAAPESEPGEKETCDFARALDGWINAARGGNTRHVAGLTRLLWTVATTDRHNYMSRRLAAYFMLSTRSFPDPGDDNPVIAAPLDARGGKRRKEVLDDIALVSTLEGRPRTIWPNEIGPKVEEYLDEMRDSLYHVDLWPHAFWQLVVLSGGAGDQGSRSFLMLFVWRVIDPVQIVMDGTRSMKLVIHNWLQANRNALSEAWRDAAGGVVAEDVKRGFSQDLAWAEMGVSVAVEMLPVDAIDEFDLCPDLPSVHAFMWSALQDERRWFAGTTHLVETESGSSLHAIAERRAATRRAVLDSALVLAGDSPADALTARLDMLDVDRGLEVEASAEAETVMAPIPAHRNPSWPDNRSESPRRRTRPPYNAQTEGSELRSNQRSSWVVPSEFTESDELGLKTPAMATLEMMDWQ
ncbi:hypothetical protein SK803_34225 [Lentzea sp. BCCO 10_0856]|uniref:Uncharacterized protein n=1 Tax=Lentzea miocenica TaxID=3095431 RepID=A0ABU4TAV0_9PSEU|nr:hypothetical protein [Lentzea sp. BCCO 10_0856]MDX8035294.1 hypothetical protein [Lentzea sp. BCCO 10_0856]